MSSSSRAGAVLQKSQDEDIYETSEDCVPIRSFQLMDMKVELLRGVFAYGWEKPSAIQQRAIVPIFKGRDVIVQSQSGTGKTAVFCLGALQCVVKTLRKPQVGSLLGRYPRGNGE